MNDTVVIVTGAAPLEVSAVADLPHDAIVIAADGGLDHALAAGLTPAGVVGDLDSISPDGLAWAEEHAMVQRHSVSKDATDTELAIATAAAMNPGHIVLISGDGDRLDHTIAAIGALGAPAVTGIPIVECRWGTQYARVLHGPGRAHIRTRPGARVSLLAMHGRCESVSIQGTEWTLDRIALEPLVGHGVSNVAVESDVMVEVSIGVLTIFVDPPPPHHVSIATAEEEPT